MKNKALLVLGGFVLTTFLIGLAIICSKEAEEKANFDKTIQSIGTF